MHNTLDQWKVHLAGFLNNEEHLKNYCTFSAKVLVAKRMIVHAVFTSNDVDEIRCTTKRWLNNGTGYPEDKKTRSS